MKSALRRAAAGAGALALAMAGAMAMGTAASAAPGVDGTPPGNADVGTTGTLNIHKFAGSTTEDVNNGTAQDVERPPLAGVYFDVCDLGLDLTTQEGWVAAAAVNASTATCPVGVNPTRVGPTDADGFASVSELAMGAYLVKEVPFEGVTSSVNFVVTIPFPSVSGTTASPTNTWLWNVHVYPKNTLTGDNSKTVDDPTANGLGSNVPWQVKTRPLGSFNDGVAMTKYSVKDAIDGRLTYVADSAVVKMRTPGGVETTLTAGTQYTLSAPTEAGGELVVDFDVAYVNGLPAGTTFVIDFATTVNSIGDGTIKNTAVEWVNGAVSDSTNTVSTHWGAAKLLKHEANAVGEVLAGAKFQVYNVNTDGSCPAPLAGSPLSVSGETTFTSDKYGVVAIPGLYVGKNSETASRVYCIVETEAPDGYVLNATPIAITVTPGAVAEDAWSAQVANTPVKGPDLPLTGAEGTLAMTIGGLLLVGAGTGAIVVSRRRHNAR